MSYYNGVECLSCFEWNDYESGIDTLNSPLESSPPLSPMKQLIAKFDEHSRKMDDLFKRLRNHDNSLDKNVKSFPTLSKFGEKNEKNIESKVLCEFDELFSEDLLVENASNFILPTLTSPLSQEEEQIVDKSSSTSCENDKGSALFNMLNDLKNMSIEDLTNLLSSTNPSLVPQPSQECLIEKYSLGEVEEALHEMVIPIQFDSEDMLIFNELVYQIECCYIDESIHEIPWKPLNNFLQRTLVCHLILKEKLRILDWQHLPSKRKRNQV